MDTEKTAADFLAIGKQRGYGTPEFAQKVLAKRAAKADATPLDLEAMKAAALAATPGQWRWNHEMGALEAGPNEQIIWPRNAITLEPESDKELLGSCGVQAETQAAQNMAHIVAAQPAAVLALIEELERTQRNRDMWKGQSERQADELRRIHVEQAEAVGFKP